MRMALGVTMLGPGGMAVTIGGALRPDPPLVTARSHVVTWVSGIRMLASVEEGTEVFPSFRMNTRWKLYTTMWARYTLLLQSVVRAQKSLMNFSVWGRLKRRRISGSMAMEWTPRSNFFSRPPRKLQVSTRMLPVALAREMFLGGCSAGGMGGGGPLMR